VQGKWNNIGVKRGENGVLTEKGTKKRKNLTKKQGLQK
jgi:hypothetical protein